MTNLITPDVLREAAKGITEADAVNGYAPAEYLTASWATIFGTKDRPAILIRYPEDDVESLLPRSFQTSYVGSLVARVVTEVARIVAGNVAYLEETDPTADDVVDALESLYTEMTQVRTDTHSRGLLVVFTSMEVD